MRTTLIFVIGVPLIALLYVYVIKDIINNIKNKK